MTNNEKINIEERIKIYESILVLNNANPNIIKKGINKEIKLELGDKQRNSLLKKINILKSVKLLLTTNYFIKDISLELNLSTSCIQRYLNDPFILELGEDIKSEIEEKLQKNLNKGRKKGSTNYVLNNIAIKNEIGEFIGSVPRI